MLNSWLTSLLLVVILVVSQAIYAGHDPLHHENGSLDCEICLYAASAGSALASSEVIVHFLPASPVRAIANIDQAIPLLRADLYQSRAPPLFLY